MFISNILKKLNRRDIKVFTKITKTKKIVFSLIIVFLFALISRQILAINNTSNTDDTFTKYADKQTAITKGNNQESWINEALLSNVVSFNQVLVGPIPEDVLAGKAKFIPGGIIGFTNQSIAKLYIPPASGTEYIANTLNNFLGKPVYAQGAVTHLSGILPLWRTLRNSVYTLFSIIFIIVGIAIMLRIKISPQAVITIQTIIPKLITSLILVTFSYAIAGLLIDSVYLLQGVFLSIIFNSNGGINSRLFSGVINPSFNSLMNAGFNETLSLATKALPGQVFKALAEIPDQLIQGVINGNALDFGSALTKIIIGPAAFAIVLLVTYIMTLIYVIKFFFGMVKVYLQIIFRIILGPLEIALGAIPNIKMGFGSWFMHLFANLAVFPLSIVFLVLVNLIIDKVDTGNLWSPPMFAGSGVLPAALGIGALMILAKLPSLIPEFIFQLKPSGFGKALGESFSKNIIAKTASNIGNSAINQATKGGMETWAKARARRRQPLVNTDTDTDTQNSNTPANERDPDGEGEDHEA